MDSNTCGTPEEQSRDKEKRFAAYASKFLWIMLSPKGRINRGEFLAAFTVLLAVQAGLAFLAFTFALGTVNNASSIHHDFFTLTIVGIVFVSYCFFAASIKRWRDMGGAIWLFIVFCVITAGLLILIPMCIFVPSGKWAPRQTRRQF